MELMVIVKLLGRNIIYTLLQNKICSLWKPVKPFRLVDIKYRYYLAKFQDQWDFEKVICQGPRIVHDQYLIVQLWSVDFSPSQPYPNVVMTWIRLSRLPGHMYNRKVLKEIGGLIGKVAKLDFNTNNGIRGKFERMAIYVNLEKPLTS